MLYYVFMIISSSRLHVYLCQNGVLALLTGKLVSLCWYPIQKCLLTNKVLQVCTIYPSCSGMFGHNNEHQWSTSVSISTNWCRSRDQYNYACRCFNVSETRTKWTLSKWHKINSGRDCSIVQKWLIASST